VQETSERAASFRGGLNVPWPDRRRWPRRYSAGWPLARLLATPERLSLRLVPPWRGLGLTAARDEVVACFGLRGVPLHGSGVGFALAGGEVAYFWTLRPRALLRTLGALGYPVGEPRRVPWRHALGFR
jgi:hypothetical protein